jgi:hypothetical protein
VYNTKTVPRWWNWQTRYLEGVVGFNPVQVQVLSSAFLIIARIFIPKS